MYRILFPLLILLLSSATRLNATHIVGGEVTYKCLGNNQYEIKLTVYRDCYNGIPWFDNPAIVGIYDANWNLTQKLLLQLDPNKNDTLPIILSNPCLTVPPDVCAHGTSYVDTVTLPISPGGYTIVYQRCCRNKLIRNLPDPLNTGISYTAFISEECMQLCNSSAAFNYWPPVAICINQPINFDHSASDPDGDSLIYHLCTPLNGPDSMVPAPNPPFAGPYQEIVWLDPPYNLSNLLGGQPLTIDSHTGFMTGEPNLIGNFVVGVCVDEYRNGHVISTTRRDFQYNVSDCGQPLAAFFAPTALCDTLRWRFVNQSSSATFFRWYFDWPNATPSSVLYSPVYTFPDTGLYVVALIAEPDDICRDTFFQQIHVTESFINADLDIQYPSCDEAGLVIDATDLSSDPVYGITDRKWYMKGPGGFVAQSTEPNPTFLAPGPGIYQLRLITTAGNGCMDTLYLPIVSPYPTIDSLNNELSICIGDTVPLNPGGNPEYIYAWTPSTSLSDPNVANPLAFPITTTNYLATVTSGICVLNDEVLVSVADPGALTVSATPTTIYQGESSQLNANLAGAVSYSWSPGASLDHPNSSNPLASPDETTTYTVTVRLSSGCIVQGSVTVKVLHPICDEPFIFFPTGFSPNGDGENDELRMEGRFVEEVYWAIYNRWGEKVFETSDLNGAWDGTFKGQPQPVETYGYYLRVRCPGGLETVKKGNVTLLR